MSTSSERYLLAVLDNKTPTMRHNTLLFDLDGTLIDQFSAIHKSVNHVQNTLGIETSSFERVKAAVGGSIRLTLKRLFEDADLESTLPLFVEHFESIMMDEVFILPGVEAFLDEAKVRNLQMAVFTNKIGKHARATVEHLNLDHYFDLVLGAEDTPYRKPNPKFTHHLTAALNTDLKDCCLIGDSPFDWQTGQAVQMPVYLLATGTHSADALRAETGSKQIYSNFTTFAEAYFSDNLCHHEA